MTKFQAWAEAQTIPQLLSWLSFWQMEAKFLKSVSLQYSPASMERKLIAKRIKLQKTRAAWTQGYLEAKGRPELTAAN